MDGELNTVKELRKKFLDQAKDIEVINAVGQRGLRDNALQSDQD